MENKKLFLFGTIFCSVVAIGLIVASVATENWVKATVSVTADVSNQTQTRGGNLSFGLFRGRKDINYGYGWRPQTVKVVCDAGAGYCLLYNASADQNSKLKGDEGKDRLKSIINIYKNSTDQPYDYALFNFGFWVCTIIFSGLAIVWGLVSIGFAIFNICGKPIETITGPLGLYLWNGLAFLCALVAMVMYVVLFLMYYKNSVLPYEENVTQSMKSDASLDFSFYFLVVSLILYFFNLILLLLSGYKLRCAFTREAEKVMDNGIILY